MQTEYPFKWNFRDLSLFYPRIVPRKVFRSSSLVSDNIVDYQGLKGIVDLRSLKEVQKVSHSGNLPIQIYHSPMQVENNQFNDDINRLPKSEFLFQRYKTYTETLQNSVGLISMHKV